MSPVFATADRLADRDGRGKEASWWSSRRISSGLCDLRSSRFRLAVLLVVPVDLEYDRLALHVLNKRPEMELKDSWCYKDNLHLVTVTVMFCTW